MGGERPAADVAAEYGIRDYGRAPTVDELREQIVAEGRARYGPFLGPLMGMLNTLGQTDDKLDAQARQLREGMLTRTAPGAPGVHYEGIPHQQLWDAVNNGVDPGAVGSVGEAWIQVGNRLVGLGDVVARAIGGSETTWTGTAAEGARQAMAGLANRSGEAGKASQLAGTVGTQQAQALATAKNTVPPPPNPPYDPRAAAQQLQTITDPVAYAQQAQQNQEQAAAQQAAHQQAAQAVRTYDQTLTATASAAPAFAPAPPAAAPADGHDGPGTELKGGSAERSRGDVGGRGTAGGGGSGPTGGQSGPGGPGSAVAGQTSSSGAGPISAPGTGGSNPADRPGLGPRPDNPHWAHGGVGPSPGGVGRGGPGGFGGKGAGGGPGSVGAPGGGGRAGVSPLGGPVAGGGTVGGRGAGRAGAAGTGAGMGAGGRGGSGADDIEHLSPDYLVEADPDGLFGTDEITAPPVIGL